MKKVRMLSTAAGPERVLLAGQVYWLPDDVADQLLSPYQPPLVDVQEVDAETGTVRIVKRPMSLPQWRFAELVTDRSVKAIRPPARPDPGDTSDEETADADDYEDL